MSDPIHILSLGAGVQSSTLALMAAVGEVTPMPTAAIFADTQAEPASVYRWLDWLEKQLPFPVHRVSKGNLMEASLRVRTSEKGNRYSQYSVPAFIANHDGSPGGLMMRQCTRDFKIDIILREVRRLAAAEILAWRKYKRTWANLQNPAVPPVVQWIGISRDEAHRMKASRIAYVAHRWPLIDLGMRRFSCLEWLAAHGFPLPPRSACIICPYRGNAEWRRLRESDPADFARAAEWEATYQATSRQVGEWRGVPFLHRSLVSLQDVDLSEDTRQGDLFGNECEGMCGV